MSFPHYPKYKEWGVEWLGKLPEHWEVTQLKRLVEPTRPLTYGIVQAGPHVSDGVPYVRPADMSDEEGVVSPSGILRTTHEIANAYARSTIRSGDLVCSIGPSFGKVMVTPEWLDGANLTQGTARIAVRAPNCARFVFWALRSASSFAQWESSVGGATFRALNLGPLAETAIAVPGEAEQALIAQLLDRETSKIDALIAEQQRLIELLKEKRQAVISHAVTKGLDPDAPMKASGVEWLGDTPVHWKVLPIRAVARMFGRIGYRGYSTQDMTAPGEGAIALSPSNMVGGRLSLAACTYIGWKKYEESPEIMVAPGNIIMVKTGSTLGKVAFVEKLDHPATINPQLLIFKDLTCFPRFLFFALSIPLIQAMVAINNTGSSIPTVSQEAIGAFRLTFPPVEEQQRIVNCIDHEVARLQDLTAEAERAIALLQERRAALISAAVTGKIDVRHLAGAEAA